MRSRARCLTATATKTTSETLRKRHSVPQLERLEARDLPSAGPGWTPIGPRPILNANGPYAGRLTVAVADPTNQQVMYVAGAVDGGLYGEGGSIWKTTDWLDPNPTWTQLALNMPSTSIFVHCLAMAPSDHNTLYAAANGPDGGILVTTDGGATWVEKGQNLFSQVAFGAIVVSPTNSKVVFAAVQVTYGGPTRGGLWQSVDGGDHWVNITPVSFGAINITDVVFNPQDPSLLYAAAVGSTSGTSNGVFQITLGSAAPGWLLVNNGMTLQTNNQIGNLYIQLAIAPSNPNIVYATVFEAAGHSPYLIRYRIDMAANTPTWEALDQPPNGPDNVPNDYRFWHVVLAVDPSDPNTIYVNGDEPDLFQARITDVATGAVSYGLLQNVEDVVEISFDAESTRGLVLVADRGVLLSPNPPSILSNPDTPSSGSFVQKRANLDGILFYQIVADPNDPHNVFGTAQDQFNTLQTATPAPAWQLLNAGGEIGTVLVDPNNAANVYVYGPFDQQPSGQGILALSTNGGASFQNAATGIMPNDYAASNDFYEAFYQAIATNSLDSTNMVIGSYHVYQSLDAGTSKMTWAVVSPDLTNGDHINDFISALAVAAVNGNRIYFAGTISGKLWVSDPNPSSPIVHWTQIDVGPFPGTIQTIAVNPANAQELFVQVDVRGGQGIWHTTDQGKHWMNITGNLPGSYIVNCLALDWRFNTPGLYAGTSRGVFYSPAAGAPWLYFGNGMPHTKITSLELLPKLDRLAAASYGNGAFEVRLPEIPLSPLVVGTGPGQEPLVKVYDAVTGVLRTSFDAYAPQFLGGVSVAVGDVNGDGVPDIIVAAGPGGGPHVKIIDGIKLSMVDANNEIEDSALIGQFYAYDPGFAGGLFVAFGRGANALPEIITGADAGGGPHVKVIDATKLDQLQPNGQIANSALVGQFYAYSPFFPGGVRVASGDVNGDGVLDIITGAGPGGGPQVLAIDGTKLNDLLPSGQIAPSAFLLSFMAYSPYFAGGVYVAGGDVNGDHQADIITGAGAGGGPHVEIFSGKNGAILQSFMAYSPLFPGGVRVGYAPAQSGAMAAVVLTGAGPGGGPQVNAFDAQSLALLDGFYAFDPQFSGGVYVGGG